MRNMILPMDVSVSNSDMKAVYRKTLIVIHLYYSDTVEKYMRYIQNIPEDIQICFTVSTAEMEAKIRDCMSLYQKKYKFIQKENRGRDISALLVASREEILKYEYVCFAHDKKEKSATEKQDMDLWIQGLWENVLGSREYIGNVLATFERQPLLGVLTPPTSLSERFSSVFDDTWGVNFENTQQLLKALGVKAETDRAVLPETLGTVLWARVPALQKLLRKEWKYEDFDAEPLAGDGTVSHAIERCFAYVAQDAGYDTRIVTTDCFAGERMRYMQEVLREAFKNMRSYVDISNVEELKKQNELYEALSGKISEHTAIYVYGAGERGKKCVRWLQAHSYKVQAFVVSEEKNDIFSCEGIKVMPFSRLEMEKDSMIIVAVSAKFREEISEELRKRDVKSEQIMYF